MTITTITTLSGREFNHDVTRVKKFAGQGRNLVEALSMPGLGEIELELSPARAQGKSSNSCVRTPFEARKSEPVADGRPEPDGNA